MASFNLSNFDAAMKHMYPYKKVENLVYKNNPLLAMIPKETKFPGKNATYAVEYGITPGRSAHFATAQANRGGTQLQEFVVTRVKDYAVVSVDNETLLAADGNEGSLLDVAKVKTNSALHALSRTMGRDVYGSGHGDIGKIDSGEGTTGVIITLSPQSDVVNFEKGMRIVCGTGTAGAALRNNGQAVEVTGVDRDGGKITISTAMETAWGTIGGDSLLYPEGDASNNVAKVKIAGLDAWLPSSIHATTDSFFGVNRAQDKTRLGGQRQAFTGSAIRVTLIDAGVKVAREGGRPDAVFMNPLDWAKLAKDLEGYTTVASGQSPNRRRYGAKDTAANFGFSSVSLATPNGIVDIYADHNCPEEVAYMLQMDTWKFKSLGAAPRILDFDGLKGVREANSDGVEYRWGYYGNMLCTAPGFNCRVALD